MELDLLSLHQTVKSKFVFEAFVCVLAQSIQKVIVPFRLWKYFLKLTSDQAISPFFSSLAFVLKTKVMNLERV